MKKLAVLIVCAAVMASCDSFSGGSKNQLKAENDSLLMELTQRNAELDEMMGTFNDISEGFRQINAAESRVDLQRGAVAEGSLNAKQQIASDIEFIRKQSILVSDNISLHISMVFQFFDCRPDRINSIPAQRCKPLHIIIPVIRQT